MTFIYLLPFSHIVCHVWIIRSDVTDADVIQHKIFYILSPRHSSLVLSSLAER